MAQVIQQADNSQHEKSGLFCFVLFCFFVVLVMEQGLAHARQMFNLGFFCFVLFFDTWSHYVA
jgi:hypothetical protein